MPSNEHPNENLEDMRRQSDEAKRQYDTLDMKPGESLRDFEYRVKRHSDKLLALKVAEKVQWQLIEQDARDAEEELKKRTPDLRGEIAVSHSGLAGRQHPLARRQRDSNRLPLLRQE